MNVSTRHEITLTVNGKTETRTVESRTTAADFLRDELRLTGTHLGCEHGVCGACTIIVGEASMRSCLMFAVQLDGMTITTVEGLAQNGKMTVLQEAFREHHALQCGFCTAGFLTTATAFLKETPDPSADEVREALSGNICRCTGYIPIVEAVLDAARTMNGKAAE